MKNFLNSLLFTLLISLTGCFNSYTHSLCAGKTQVNLNSYVGEYSMYMNFLGQEVKEGKLDFKKGSSQGTYSLYDEYGEISFEDMVSCKVGNQIILESEMETESGNTTSLFSTMLVEVNPNNELILSLSELDYDLLSQDNVPTVELAPDASYGLGEVLVAIENQNLTAKEVLLYFNKPGIIQIKK